MTPEEVRFNHDGLYGSYLNQNNQSPFDLSHSHSVNTIPSIHDYIISEDLLAGQRLNGRMSNVRRFFCLFVTFDCLFISLMWLICIMLVGENIVNALSEQILHYDIHSSLIDIVLVAFCRFLVLIFFYGILYLNHWIVISLSTALSCAFLIGKVFMYDWPKSSQPVLEVLLVLASFILSWGEAWFLDFRVIPQESHADRYLIGIEALCILLRRLAYPNRLGDVENIFGRSPAALSEICNFMSNYIYENHGHLLENIAQLPWLNRERFNLYADAISARGAAIDNCWALIDGTARAICRPTDEQEEYYSGHKRFHCVKYQSLLSPDGLIVSLLGAYPGRRHDAFIFGQSGLYEQLEENTRFENGHYVIYGDHAYGIRELLLCPYPGRGVNEAQQNFNVTMSRVRQAVEWGFQKIIMEFAVLDFKKNQKLLLQDIECIYKASALLTNCHTCLYGSETAQYFNIQPPHLEQYLGI